MHHLQLPMQGNKHHCRCSQQPVVLAFAPPPFITTICNALPDVNKAPARGEGAATHDEDINVIVDI